MTAHVHAFTRVGLSSRYVCACSVVGHRRTGPGFLRAAIVPFTCQKQLAGKTHCGADAVHVTGDRQASRCAEHAPKHQQGVSP